MTDTTPSLTESTIDPRERPRSTLLGIMRYRDDIEICTLFAPTAVAPQRTDAWIRANEGSFRALEKCRWSERGRWSVGCRSLRATLSDIYCWVRWSSH